MNNLINDFLKRDLASPIKVAVVGDAMIDQYFGIKVKRISPEFPIPTYLSEDDECLSLPGGAANVAYQLTNFNVKVSLISFVDKEAEYIFDSHGIDTSLCVEIPTKIPRKRRFYAEYFPTYRWDVERVKYGLKPKELKNYSDILYNNIVSNDFDVVIFSDYNKGVFANYAIPLNIRTDIKIVDPKCDLSMWYGCTIFKPNRNEALALSKCDDIEKAALFLQHKLCCESVVITDGDNGVLVLEKQKISYISSFSSTKSVKSVIGAGDAFSSFLSMATARGFSVKDAAEIAWIAGTKYVQNMYNKPLFPIDLVQDKIITEPEVLNTRDFRLVFTNGVFDLFHSGHLECLKFAKSKGDKLVVAVNSDESVARLKPGRPYVALKDRMATLAALEMVDYVVSFDEDTPLNLIGKIIPEVLVKGADYKIEDIVGENLVGEVYTCPLVEGVSTTNLIDRITRDNNYEYPIA